MTESFDVTWELDALPVHGTLVRPNGPGPFPAVIMVAGSGPTDRDWCSALIPGRNGSGRLLAETLAEAGIVSLRYDKRAADPRIDEHIDQLMGQLSMASHLAELVGGVGVLVAHDFVDGSRIVGLGNSEGTLHVLHYATSEQPVPFAGLVLAAPPGRSVGQVILAQLAAQAAQVPDGERLMGLVREATARYERGEPMRPDAALPEPIRQLLTSLEVPINLPLARELWDESALDHLPDVTIPTLIMIGGKDLQVDAHADGDPLQEAAAGQTNVTFTFPPDANHVLKHEPRPLPEVMADPTHPGYNEDGTVLDPEAVTTILDWLQEIIGLSAA